MQLRPKLIFFVRKTLTLTAVPALRKTTSCHAEGHTTTFLTVLSPDLYFALSFIFVALSYRYFAIYFLFLSLVLFSLCSFISSFIAFDNDTVLPSFLHFCRRISYVLFKLDFCRDY
jgi:hypothetical protein